MLLLSLLSGCTDYELGAAAENDYAAPDIIVSPSSLYFGVLDEGDVATEAITIENVGNASLNVVAMLVEGTGFTTPSTFPFEIEPEDEIEVYVTYETATSSDAGTAYVISNDPDTTEVQVPLFGGYSGPKLQISPEIYSFDERMLDCYSSKVFTLTNIGGETLSLHDVSLSTAEGGFEISEPPESWDLEPQRSTEVEVSFVPTDNGTWTTELTVESNDPDGVTTAPVLGIGDDLGRCEALDLSFLVEYEIADVAFLLDTTGSMGTLASTMAQQFSGIAGSLSKEIEDITFGVASFRDYNYGSFGGQGDLPFTLMSQQTSDLSRVQSALDSISAGGGGDGEEASMEAIYQATTGKGYDQECDGYYDSSTDVPSFDRSADDAFNGSESGVGSSGIEGTGDLGGMGFREDVLPVLILATDAPFRDPDNGYAGPGGCLQDAGYDEASAGLSDLSASLIGVGVNYSSGSTSYAQMAGIADLVVTWNSGDPNFQETIVEAVQELIGDAVFDKVWLDIVSDTYNMVDAVNPNQWKDVPSGTQVDFTVTVNSALVAEATEDTYVVVLELYGQIDEAVWLLDTISVNVQIPESE